MLSNEEVLSQTVDNGLFYLRTIREFCANIRLAFLEKNKSYSETARQFGLKCEELGAILTKYADGNVSKFTLDSEVFVTEYTLPCELLTEELFGIDIATEITEAELKFKPGVPTNVSDEDVNILMEVNRNALVLTQNFSDFLRDIYNKENNNQLFSYSYPHLIKYMIEETELYGIFLKRIIERRHVDPTYVTDYEYMFAKSMRDSAMFIRSFVNPANQDVFIAANSYVLEFDYLMNDYKTTSLSPDNQKELTTKSLKIVNRFSKFISDCIRQLLDAKLYFIVEPIFLDNMYTESNYFKYILTLNMETEKSY